MSSMIIGSLKKWAYTPEQEKISKENLIRYNTLLELKPKPAYILVVKTENYDGYTMYTGYVCSPNLDPKDIILLCDGGLVMFGGYCTVNPDDSSFSVKVNRV